MGLGGAKRWERGEVLKSSYGGGQVQRGDHFYGGEWTPLDTMEWA